MLENITEPHWPARKISPFVRIGTFPMGWAAEKKTGSALTEGEPSKLRMDGWCLIYLSLNPSSPELPKPE